MSLADWISGQLDLWPNRELASLHAFLSVDGFADGEKNDDTPD